MANLQANNAAGGPRQHVRLLRAGTGTNPLPIYLAYFNGSRRREQPGGLLRRNWTNTTFAGRLTARIPNPSGAAEDLDGNDGAPRSTRCTAGLPANLFVSTRTSSGVDVCESAAFSDYHALQIELRRRLSRGLQINGSYQYALEGGSAFLGRHYGRVMNPRPPTCGTRSRCSGTGPFRSAADDASAPT